MPVLTFQDKRFWFQCKFEERTIAKDAGFFWDTVSKMWCTPDLATAVNLREYAVGEARSRIDQTFLTYSPWTRPLSRVPINLNLMPHQVEAIKFALERNRSYLGLDPGLGKTIVAAIICAELRIPTIYICPPFLLQNVEAEFMKWAPEIHVSLFSRIKSLHALYPVAMVSVVPDSLLIKGETITHIDRFTSGRSCLLIVDEAHRFKNQTAKRTNALFEKICDKFSKHIFMSGTPMPNRPVELYPILSKLAPETIDFMTEFQYGRKFCAGYRSQWGWDFSGASNMAELASRVIYPKGKFMLRQKKALLNLPPKLEEIFVVSEDMSPKLAKYDKEARDVLGTVDINTELLITEQVGGPLASYRRLLGVEKANCILPYIESLLEETEENILVFGFHKDVITKLSEGLTKYKPFVITGATPVNERQQIVSTFQTDETRVLIGNYLACGVGFTLTKATRVIFVEFDWVPGVNAQASDRAHRIGQKDSVLVQYVAYKDSIDKAVIESLLRKQRTFNLGAS